MSETAPELLRRAAAYAMPAGPVDAGAVRLTQRGTIRLGPDRPWLTFRARQTTEVRRVGFRWDARVRMTPLMRTHVIDAYEDGRGRLQARLWGLVRAADDSGPDVDLGQVLRYLAELAWCPPALLGNDALRWEEAGDDRLRVSFPPGGPDAVLDLEVAEDGRIEGARAEARPRALEDETVPTPWEGRFLEPVEVGGLVLPRFGEVAWLLEDGPFTYWRGEITDLQVIDRA